MQVAAVAPSQSPAQSPTDTNPLASNRVVQRTAIYDPDSAIGKQITIFLHQVKLVSDPIQLTGSSNYTSWKESILSQARTVKCHHILEKKEVAAFIDTNNKILWKCVNDWLFDLIWDSISLQAKLHIEAPTD